METVFFTSGGYGFRAKFTDFGLCGMYFGYLPKPKVLKLTSRGRALKVELDEYFAGERMEFSFPLDLEEVTDFQFKVYEQLLMVPYGTTASYGDIAKRVGRPKGAQAVGQAVRQNPIGIIIPCHRIIASDGSIGGFGGNREGSSIDLKRKLLAHEGVMSL